MSLEQLSLESMCKCLCEKLFYVGYFILSGISLHFIIFWSPYTLKRMLLHDYSEFITLGNGGIALDWVVNFSLPQILITPYIFNQRVSAPTPVIKSEWSLNYNSHEHKKPKSLHVIMNFAPSFMKLHSEMKLVWPRQTLFISKQCLIIIIITRAGPSLRPLLPCQPNSQITSLFTVRCLGSAHFWELLPIKLWYLQ